MEGEHVREKSAEDNEKLEEKVEIEKEEIKWFECNICKMKEAYDSKEIDPDFLKYIIFNEETYIMKDPFTHPSKKQFFVLGSDCCICKNPVCQSADCSIFFQKRFCQKCAYKNKSILPQQLWPKIKNPENV